MKKVICTLLALLFISSAGYAQKPQQARLKAYQELEKQRIELLNWPKEHFFAVYWAKQKRKDQAQQLRQQQYRQFRDVEMWKLQQTQAFIKQVNQQFKGRLPYVESNLFAAQNLEQLSKDQPQLFKSLLELYPENIAQADTQFLLELLAKDPNFAAYVTDYVTYLKTYVLFPQCVEEMPSYYKDKVKWAQTNKNPRALMSVLAQGCLEYAAAKGQKQLAELDLQHALANVK